MTDGPDWGPVRELGPGEPSPYPLDVLPDWLRRHVESVTEACQVPSELPFLLSLTGLSVAAANKARVEVRRGYTEPAHLWTVTVLPPASRKSAVFSHMVHPLREWEEDRAQEARPKRQRKLDQKEVAEKRLEKAKRAASKARDEDRAAGELRQEMREAREQLEEMDVPSLPRLVASDVTSEELARLMADNHGRIAVLAPEGDIFRIMAGRYSDGLNFDAYKRAWTGGEPIRDDRVGREGTHVPRPALTLGLTVQPTVLDTLEAKESFRGEGLLGRFLYGMPDSGIGSRKTGKDVPPLDEEAAEAYRRNLRRLLEIDPKAVDSEGMYVPHTLPLADAAVDVWDAFTTEVEETLGTGGRLEYVRDWGGKLVGHSLRTAVLLQTAERIGRGEHPWGGPVSREAMRGAVRVGRAAVGHALRVFDRLEMEQDQQLARYVLRRLRNLDQGAPSVRDLHRACQGKAELESVEDLHDVLSTLEAHNYVRVQEARSAGPGRSPSPSILLHPDVTSDVDRIDGNRTDDASEADSVDSVNAHRGNAPQESSLESEWESF